MQGYKEKNRHYLSADKRHERGMDQIFATKDSRKPYISFENSTSSLSASFWSSAIYYLQCGFENVCLENHYWKASG